MPDTFPPPSTTDQPPHAGDGAAPDDEAVMSFLDHLEELRWSLLWGGLGIMVAVVVAAFFSNWIVNTLLIGPTRPSFFMYDVLGINARELDLLNRTITGQFFADLGTIVIVGIIIGSPVLVYFLWRFIEPALYPEERSGMRFASAFATFFFLLGTAFGYLILTPLALQFFAGYQLSDQIINQFDIITYFTMVTYWTVGTGLLFELPVVVYFLAKVGIITPEMMRTYRRHALVVILVLAAFLTPPDPVSQVIVGMPLLFLYEVSIYVARYVQRKQEKALST
ncbi:twin-arginine translocase subunit TatC [Salisaeta longa]|uniref:twin-arginine translocase subunit TatC n=1 Tax=Salisaeta longa TaxID=503170 RepID=UPI00049093F7|nr:twin-arginine translocase subunit TatC [Salisaeta longa]